MYITHSSILYHTAVNYFFLNALDVRGVVPFLCISFTAKRLLKSVSAYLPACLYATNNS
jgi:hypothetical protein